MDIASEIADYLDDAGYGTVGTDIFVGQIPEETNGIYVDRFGGTLNNYVAIEETLIDVYVKDSSASTAVTTAENIKRYLHRMHTTDTDNAHIYSILALGDVEPLDRDYEFSKLYKISFSVMHRDTSLIS